MADRLRFPLLALAAVALAATAGAARADWLMTKDGGRIETKGPWKVDGRRIVFTAPNGTLASIRADEVDLDLSAAETARAAEAALLAATPRPEPKKEPVIRLTEKDIPPTSGEGEEAAPAEGAAADKGAATTSSLEVASWQKSPTADGESVEIFGTLRNGGTVNVTSPSVMVMIYGPDGGLLATNEAAVNAGMIPAGKTANFRVAFPGVPDFAAVKFDAQGRGFKTNPEGTSGEGGEAPGSGAESQPPPAPEPPAEAPPPPAD